MSDVQPMSPSHGQEETAGFAARTMAFLIDLSILGLLQIGLFVLGGWCFLDVLPLDLAGVLRGSIAALLLLLVVPPLFCLTYFTFLQVGSGQTFGKMFLGIRVVTLEGERMGLGRSFLRSTATQISALPFAAGFFWAVLDNKQRTWHDLIAGTKVITA